jgi:3-oxoacyl-[acyl-carrier protein] reductase
MPRFSDQVAVISGGADGLGKGIATRILAEGGKVALFDMNEFMLSKTLDEFKQQGFAAEGFVVDVSSERDVADGVSAVEAIWGRIDVMVNCAGIVGPSDVPITGYEPADFDKVYQVNLRGSFLMTRSVIGVMEKQRYGRILLLASMAGKEGNPFMVGYSSMKAGVIGLVKSVGKEYAESGITVNGLAPAVIQTAMNASTAPAQLARLKEKIPMKRLGTVEEVAAMACWIVSPEATFTTGFTYDLSGGRATY